MRGGTISSHIGTRSQGLWLEEPIATTLRATRAAKAGNRGSRPDAVTSGTCRVRRVQAVWLAGMTKRRVRRPRSRFLLMRDGPGCRLALPVVGGPIRGCPAKLTAEPARKVTGRGKAEEFGDLIQPAFAVGQILLGEFSTYSIDDRCDALTLGRQLSVKGASMHAKMLGNPIDRTKSAWQQHPDDLARPLRRLVAEVGQLHVQPSLHLAIQRRVCSRDWHVQVAAATNDGIAFL